MKNIYDVIIIGGGASGLVLCESLIRKGLTPVVLEAADRVGKKILATGNGKCNLSNVDMQMKYYNNEFPQSVINSLGTQTVINYFQGIGLKTREIEGRIYPYSESSSDVLNALRKKTEKYCKCGIQVRAIKKDGDIFEVEGFKGRAVVLASGSSATMGISSYALAKTFSHSVVTPAPSLVGLVSSDEAIKGLAGIRVKASLSLYSENVLLKTDLGELLFKQGGISGIVTLNLSTAISRTKKRKFEVYCDFIPDYTIEDVEKFGAESFLRRPLFAAVKKQADIRKVSPAQAAKSFRIAIDGLGDNRNAQVVSGGLNTNEFHPLTLESKLVQGFYAVGEVLDVDGECGGYNLHWAFASALACANAILNNSADSK